MSTTSAEKPTIKRSLFGEAGNESHENPFTADGELSVKADYILRHSLISRTAIRISDPDLSAGEHTIERAEDAGQSFATPNDVGRLNGKTVTPKQVEVEVMTANATQPEPQQAEQVKLKEPKCKCCTIM